MVRTTGWRSSRSDIKPIYIWSSFMSESLLLRIEDIEEMLRVPRRTLQRLRRDGQFPEPTVQLGRFPAWSREVILEVARGEWKPDGQVGRREPAAATR
jgi:predicted DNA-binding transcriptional regulator AlpA